MTDIRCQLHSRRRGGRPRLFTDDVLAAIPRWVQLGASREEIAEVIGTTVGSLVVTCAQHGISLSGGAISDLTLQRSLPDDKRQRLRRYARDRGVPVAQLVLDVLEAVLGEDDAGSILDAVLDDAEE